MNRRKGSLLVRNLLLEILMVGLCCDVVNAGRNEKEFYSMTMSLFIPLECNSTEHIKSQDSQHTPHSMTASTTTVPRSSTPSHGQTTAPEPTPAPKTPAKVVYVFSTEMANK